MAEKKRFLDVWIVETNTVYREVPFAVVADWVQEGRLLEDDQLRPSGTRDWLRLGGMAEFAPYLPREEPLRPQDQAEALEPVQLDFAWKRRHDEEEDDPDMIPLIDVSLVLLIFFLMTATGAAVASTLRTPSAYYNLMTSSPDLLAVGIDCDEQTREPTVYWLSQGDKPPPGPKAPEHAERVYEVRPGDNDRQMRVPPGFLALLDRQLAAREGPVEVVIKTHEKLKDGYYVNLLVELERRRVKVHNKYDGVREKPAP